MKLTVCIIVLMAVIVLARGESCSNHNDCHHVSCPPHDFTRECVQGVCTCSQHNSQCIHQWDCSHDGCNGEMHCIDGQCRCSGHMPPPVGK